MSDSPSVWRCAATDLGLHPGDMQRDVGNLFGDDSLIPVAVQPDGYTWATVRVAPNREWFLTNTFNF